MDWMHLIQNVAFPVVSTVALAVVVYKIANIFYQEVYRPQQTKHLELVAKLEISLDKLVESQDRLVLMIDKVMDKLEEHEHRISSIEKRVI
jgi:hypothetical protein